MRRLPTDLELLNAVYERYYSDFVAHSRADPIRDSKIYVPIEIDEIARAFKVDPHLVFGRLYYHLDAKYRYKQDSGAMVHFFTLGVGDDRHCVNFPYVASVLADLRDQHRKNYIATAIALVSLIISLVSVVISVST
jgi:hypothetical protein